MISPWLNDRLFNLTLILWIMRYNVTPRPSICVKNVLSHIEIFYHEHKEIILFRGFLVFLGTASFHNCNIHFLYRKNHIPHSRPPSLTHTGCDCVLSLVKNSNWSHYILLFWQEYQKGHLIGQELERICNKDVNAGIFWVIKDS